MADFCKGYSIRCE